MWALDVFYGRCLCSQVMGEASCLADDAVGRRRVRTTGLELGRASKTVVNESSAAHSRGDKVSQRSEEMEISSVDSVAR